MEKSFYKTGLGAWELITQDGLVEMNGPDAVKCRMKSSQQWVTGRRDSSVFRIMPTNAKEMIHTNEKKKKSRKDKNRI